MSNIQEYYTVQELSEMWKMTIPFIRKEIRTGKLECTHFGRSVRISEQQVNTYIKNFVN